MKAVTSPKKKKVAQTSKKLWNYFLAMSKTDDFNSRISKIRNIYGIKNNGFANNEEREVWINSRSDPNDRLNLEIKILNAINKICNHFDFDFYSSEEIIYNYLYFNKVGHIEDFFNLCNIGDAIEENMIGNEAPGDTISFGRKGWAYPVIMRISPYASLRDILGFVKKAYKIEIKPLQDKYKNNKARVGKIKSKNSSVQKRDKFIYESRNLPRREIKELVKEKFKVNIDYEYVGKIISNEKKKRKKL